MAPLSLFHSISSVSSDISIFPILDIATLELIQYYSSESQTRLTPDLAIRLTKLRENQDRGILDRIQSVETQKVRNGWALSPTVDVVRLSLDSNVADRLCAERKSRIIFPYGTVGEGSAILSLIRRMIAEQLGLADPLCIRLQYTPKNLLPEDEHTISRSQGVERPSWDDRVPLQTFLDIMEGDLRVSLVEYITVAILTWSRDSHGTERENDC